MRFADSPHVQHYRYHEEAYLRELATFLHEEIEAVPLPLAAPTFLVMGDESPRGDMLEVRAWE